MHRRNTGWRHREEMGLPSIIPDVLIRHDPLGDALPVIFDSPHSGAVYPTDFDFAAPLAVMRRAEDAFVDELFETAPVHEPLELRVTVIAPVTSFKP